MIQQSLPLTSEWHKARADAAEQRALKARKNHKARTHHDAKAFKYRTRQLAREQGVKIGRSA